MKLDNIKIKNFKSLKDIDIKLNNLTLIAGVNSSGKSSLIQSLLLFKESLNNILFENQFRVLPNFNEIYKAELPKKTISFNGVYLRMGDEKLLLSHESLGDQMTFEVRANTDKVNIKINQKLEIEHDSESNFEVLNIFADHCFGYLNTDRAAPALAFPFSTSHIKNNSIGLSGEYVAHYLAENSRQYLKIEKLKHPNSKTLQLLENTYKWLGEISNGVTIKASSDASTQSSKLVYQYEYGGNTTSDYSPLNVGFGLTYVLPVIVLILKSKPGDLLIIENPESHLHPAGQSKIAELCAIAAHNGVQIIVETHSDHFLNGLRVATKSGVVHPDESQIYYFEKKNNNLDTIAHSINIDKDGRIDEWPKGFFDEWDNKLNELLW